MSPEKPLFETLEQVFANVPELRFKGLKPEGSRRKDNFSWND